MERRWKSCKVRLDSGRFGRAGAGSGQHASSMARPGTKNQSAAKSAWIAWESCSVSAICQQASSPLDSGERHRDEGRSGHSLAHVRAAHNLLGAWRGPPAPRISLGRFGGRRGRLPCAGGALVRVGAARVRRRLGRSHRCAAGSGHGYGQFHAPWLGALARLLLDGGCRCVHARRAGDRRARHAPVPRSGDDRRSRRRRGRAAGPRRSSWHGRRRGGDDGRGRLGAAEPRACQRLPSWATARRYGVAVSVRVCGAALRALRVGLGRCGPVPGRRRPR